MYDPKLESIRNQIHASANGTTSNLDLVARTNLSAGKRHPKLVALFAEKEKGVHFGTVPCLDRVPIGLTNMGESCYLSVILQALLHNPIMNAYFVQNRHDSIGCLMNHCIACAMAKSMGEISTADTISAYAPIDLLAASWHHSTVRFPFIPPPRPLF